MKENNEYKWHFIGSIGVVSIIAIIGFVCLSTSYRKRLDKIADLQKKDGRRIEYILKAQAKSTTSTAVEVENLTEVFKEHEGRMQGLMDIEFEKLQNDYNFISLWSGIITIVFLIFSIYSIFKTDEMLKKSEKVYEEIKGKAGVIDNFTNNIRDKYQTELANLRKKSDDYIKELSQKISLLDNRLANIDVLIKQVKNRIQDEDSVQVSSGEEPTQEPKEA